MTVCSGFDSIAHSYPIAQKLNRAIRSDGVFTLRVRQNLPHPNQVRQFLFKQEGCDQATIELGCRCP